MGPKIPRSNGCITCKRRRVKCDEARPTCRRCLASYNICDGYEGKSRHSIFVNSTVQDLTLASEGRALTVTALPIRNSSPRTMFDPWAGAQSSVPRNPDRPDKENVWVSHLAHRLFPGSVHNPELGSWIFEMIKLDGTSLAYLTVCCVGAAFYGRTHGMIRSDIDMSSSYYAKALKALSANLCDPVLRHSPTNVPAAMLLGIYELMVYQHNGGFVKHAGGVSTLIQSRGPDAHKSFPARTYFSMARTAIIPDALVRRKRCFLEEPEWQSVTTNVPAGPIKDGFEIGDIMCRVPGLMEDHETARQQLKATGKAPQDAVTRFRARVHSFLRDLFVWRWKWQRLYGDVAYEVPVNSSSQLSVDEHGRPIFDSVIYYRSFFPARQLGFYRSCIILVLEVADFWGVVDAPAKALASLQTVGDRPASAGPLALPHVGTSRQEAAREVLRSVEYYLQGGTHRLAGAMHLLVPLRMASMVVTDARQIAWLKRITDRMAECHGFGFSLRLQDVERFSKDWKFDP